MPDRTINEFVSALSSAAPTPGGGGASALCAAVGMALGQMVGALTVGKERFAASEVELRKLMGRGEELREALLACIEKDAAAFEPLSRAYRIPRDEPGRTERMESCLRAASAPPLEMMELCAGAVALLERYAELGNPLAISDAATGAALCRGALWGAAVNVRVNAVLMTDRNYAETLLRRADGLLDETTRRADALYAAVCGKLG